MARVLIAMSGGVDSSVAAFLLKEQGYDVVGCTMALHGSDPEGPDAALVRRAQADVADARAAAERLNIPHHMLDLSKEFDEAVVRYFVETYEAGLTPNPCVVCNRRIKFGALLDYAHELGCEYLATGHYARICHSEESGRFELHKAADLTKDQSYFLSRLTQEQLGCALLPLGGLTKTQVRAIAEQQGFANAHKSDSQNICFIPDADYRSFLERYRGHAYEPGDVLAEDGQVIGTHDGAVGYTIGQRKGLGVAYGEPVFVCAKDMAVNTITVGPPSSLMARSCLVDGWNWIDPPSDTPVRALIRTHYRHIEEPATVMPLADSASMQADNASVQVDGATSVQIDGVSVQVDFDMPSRAPAPGQVLVAYDGDRVIGGGFIREALRASIDE